MPYSTATPLSQPSLGDAGTGLVPGSASLPDGQPGTLPALLRWRAQQTPDSAGCAWLVGATWTTWTWSAWWREVQERAAGLQAAGLRPGDHLAIWARSGRDWDLVHLAAMTLGAVVIGLDERGSPAQLAHQLSLTRPVALIVQDEAAVALIPAPVRAALTLLVVLAQTSRSDPALIAWENLRVSAPVALPTIAADQPATIIFTSGTTGEAKGIRYQQRHLLVACDAIVRAFGADIHGGTAICWMPLCQLFQRMLNLVAIRAGTTVHYLADPRQLFLQLAVVEPRYLAGVPRIFEKLQALQAAEVADLPRWRRPLAAWALRVGAARAQQPRGLLRGLRSAVAQVLILARLRRSLGRNLRFLITGSAPCPPWLIEHFAARGVALLEAYGTSECTVPICMNLPQAHRRGSVGRPLWPNQVSLQDGEVLVRGAGLFSGYLGAPPTEGADGTSTVDGFYRTGDLGHFDDDGYLFLTGRIRELIKTSSGRRIAPAGIEAQVRSGMPQLQVVVLGHGRKHLVGLLHDPALQQAGAGTVAQAACRGQLVHHLTSVNATLARHERIGAWGLLERPLDEAAGELTGNGKLRRPRIHANHALLIERLYAAAAPGAQDARILSIPDDATLLAASVPSDPPLSAWSAP